MAITDGVVTPLPAPIGYDVDFDHPQQQGVPTAYWVVGVGNVLAVAFLSQRIFTKLRITHNFGLDDTCLLLAWACSITVQAVTARGFAAGVVGVHGWEMSMQQYSYYEILVLIAPVVYAPGTCFAKLSLLLFYIQISPQRWFQWAIRIMIIIIAGYSIGIFFSYIFACDPIQKAWDATITTGSCINLPALYIVTAVLGVATDFVIALIPLPVVLRLQLSKKHKAGLVLLFTIGSLTLITSIVRLVILFPLLTNVDQTWAIAYGEIWIAVEANLQMICASSTTVRKFLGYLAPAVLGANPPGHEPAIELGDLITFGQRSTVQKPRRYSQFDNEDGRGDVATSVSRHDEADSDRKLRPDVTRGQWSSRVGSSQSPSEMRLERDICGDSEHAIVQTRTTVVSVEWRQPVG